MGGCAYKASIEGLVCLDRRLIINLYLTRRISRYSQNGWPKVCISRGNKAAFPAQAQACIRQAQGYRHSTCKAAQASKTGKT